MTAQIGFGGGAWFEVDEGYELVTKLHADQLAKGQVYEVNLPDGTYAPVGTRLRLTVNPSAVAYIEELP